MEVIVFLDRELDEEIYIEPKELVIVEKSTKVQI